MMKNEPKHLGNWVQETWGCMGKWPRTERDRRVIAINGSRKEFAHARIVPTIILKTGKEKEKEKINGVPNPHLQEWKVVEVMVGKAKAAERGKIESENKPPLIEAKNGKVLQERYLEEYLPREKEIDRHAMPG